MRKLRVEEPGDTQLLPGGVVDIHEFAESNAKAYEEGGEPATGKPVILGITKASLSTDSFLSAASFRRRQGCLPTPLLRARSTTFLG